MQDTAASPASSSGGGCCDSPAAAGMDACCCSSLPPPAFSPLRECRLHGEPIAPTAPHSAAYQALLCATLCPVLYRVLIPSPPLPCPAVPPPAAGGAEAHALPTVDHPACGFPAITHQVLTGRRAGRWVGAAARHAFPAACPALCCWRPRSALLPAHPTALCPHTPTLCHPPSTQTLRDLLVHGPAAFGLAGLAVVDCRYDYEFAGGHLPGALRPALPLGSVEQHALHAQQLRGGAQASVPPCLLPPSCSHTLASGRSGHAARPPPRPPQARCTCRRPRRCWGGWAAAPRSAGHAPPSSSTASSPRSGGPAPPSLCAARRALVGGQRRAARAACVRTCVCRLAG